MPNSAKLILVMYNRNSEHQFLYLTVLIKMRLPVVDLKAQYLTRKPELDIAVITLITKTVFIIGRYAAEKE